MVVRCIEERITGGYHSPSEEYWIRGVVQTVTLKDGSVTWILLDMMQIDFEVGRFGVYQHMCREDACCSACCNCSLLLGMRWIEQPVYLVL